ncbi:MAG: M3 family oligoendopeptidase [Phycisphaerales bacterium]
MNLMDTSFVPADLDAAVWSNIEPLLAELQARPVNSAADFEQWIRDRSELAAACSESRARLYITMSCNTDDAEANAAYTKYIESVPPRLSPAEFELDRKHVALSEQFPLDEARYKVLNRSRRAAVELFREENVPIQTQLSRLSQEYDRIAGAQTVQFDGREQTLPMMARYLEQNDRAVRESAWRAIAARRFQDRDALNDVFNRMIERRHALARNAGFDNYIGYAFREKERFDYAPKDCQAYWHAVEKHVVPLMRHMDERRRAALNVPSLRPWDLAVDELGRPPLRPFDGGRDLVNKTLAVFQRLDPRLAGMMQSLAAPPTTGHAPPSGPSDAAMRSESLDLDSRKGKRPGGYQYMRDRSRRPFIFMNAAGLHRDVMTMVHEAGHAFHSMLCVHEPLVEYRHSPIEFAEVASMSMEHLTMPYWGASPPAPKDPPGSHHGRNGHASASLGYYADPNDLARARRAHLEDSITILAWIATIDAFQHWIYANPDHTPDARDSHWIHLDERFGRRVDWSPDPADAPSMHQLRRSAWQRQSHLFGHPMYYIEYGIAQLGSLQLWLRAKNEGERAAVDAYIHALSLGGSRPLPDLFAAAGLRFDFGDSTVHRIVDALHHELERLER